MARLLKAKISLIELPPCCKGSEVMEQRVKLRAETTVSDYEDDERAPMTNAHEDELDGEPLVEVWTLQHIVPSPKRAMLAGAKTRTPPRLKDRVVGAARASRSSCRHQRRSLCRLRLDEGVIEAGRHVHDALPNCTYCLLMFVGVWRRPRGHGC